MAPSFHARSHAWARISADNCICKLTERNAWLEFEVRELQRHLNEAAVGRMHRSQSADDTEVRLRHSQAYADGDMAASLHSASVILREALNNRFNLSAPADRNLGTALSVRAVRHDLRASSACKGNLLRELGYIASAADGLRHLTPYIIQQTVESFLQHVATSPAQPCPDVRSVGGDDGFERADDGLSLG